MSRWLTAVVVLLASCDPRGLLDVSGDCPEAVTLADGGRPCDTYPCRLPRGTELRLVDGLGCTSDCASEGRCSVSETTRVVTHRSGWPVFVEANGVVNARLLPSLEDCTTGCFAIVPVATTSTLEARARPGHRVTFSGDCDAVEPERCSFVADKERRVFVGEEPDTVRLSVTVSGSGRVTSNPASIDCPGQCVAEFPRGTTVGLNAEAAPQHLLRPWGDPRCVANTCAIELVADTSVSAVFVPSVHLTLSAVDASGPTRTLVNGAEFVLPLSLAFEAGQRVLLRARPAADDTLVGFDGLECETPRLFDECALTLSAETRGTLRMHRLHQWAVGAFPSLYLGNIDASDSGVLSAVFHIVAIPSLGLPQQTRGGGAVLELNGDGGINVKGFGQTGLGPMVLIRDGLGVAWLAGNTRTGLIEPSVNWGGFDAGIPRRGTSFQELAFLRLDGGSIDHVKTVPLSMLDGTPSVSAATGPAVHFEGRLLTPLDWTGPFDGGTQASGVANWSQSFSLEAFRTSQRGRPVDLAKVGGSLMQLSLSSAPTTVVADTCQVPSSNNQIVIATVDGSAACVSPVVLGASSAVEGVVGYGPLMRGAGVAAWGTEQQELLGPNKSIVVRSMNSDLSLNWSVDVRPTPAPSSFESLGTFMWRGRILSLVSMAHAPETLVKAGSTTIRCAAAGGASSLILMAHSTSTGAVEWGVCLDAKEGGAERFRLAQRNSLNYRSAELALGGLLIAPDAVGPAVGVMHVGSSSVSVSNVAGHYYLLLTPP